MGWEKSTVNGSKKHGKPDFVVVVHNTLLSG